MLTSFDEQSRIEAVKTAFRRLLLPRLDADTSQQRTQGMVFYRGRWMPQNEATRIHYMLARDSERTFFDVLVFVIVLVLVFALVMWRGPIIMMRLL